MHLVCVFEPRVTVYLQKYKMLHKNAFWQIYVAG